MLTINKSIKITALLLLSFAVCQSALAGKPPKDPKPPKPPQEEPVGPTDSEEDLCGDGNTWYVDPVAGDNHKDDVCSDEPFASIQKAVNMAYPGDTIVLAEGDYLQDIVTVRNGLDGLPIVIEGPFGAVIRGGGNARIFEINHSYITLDGFSINGLHGNPHKKSGYRDKLVFVLSKVPGSGPTGLEILNMHFSNAGGVPQISLFCEQ